MNFKITFDIDTDSFLYKDNIQKLFLDLFTHFKESSVSEQYISTTIYRCVNEYLNYGMYSIKSPLIVEYLSQKIQNKYESPYFLVSKENDETYKINISCLTKGQAKFAKWLILNKVFDDLKL